MAEKPARKPRGLTAAPPALGRGTQREKVLSVLSSFLKDQPKALRISKRLIFGKNKIDVMHPEVRRSWNPIYPALGGEHAYIPLVPGKAFTILVDKKGTTIRCYGRYPGSDFEKLARDFANTLKNAGISSRLIIKR